MSQDERKEIICKIDNTSENFETWINKPYIPHEMHPELKKASILIIPTEDLRGVNTPQFPVGTIELYNHLKETLNKDHIVDICISDDNYEEYAFHDITMLLGAFVVTTIVAPIFVNVLSNLINKKLDKKNNKASLKFEMTVVSDSGSAKKITYDGPSDVFERTMINSLKKIKGNEE